MRKTLLLAGTLCATLALNAQNSESKRGPYETNKFFDNWFLSIGGGVNLYEGENDEDGKFGKRLAPAMDFSVGKWIIPTVGLRMQYAGGEAKGNISYLSDFARPGKMYKNLYREKFDMHVLHADVMWNMTNAIMGFNEKRVWNLIPYAGFGGVLSSGNGINNYELGGVLGLINTFRISNRVDINLEARQLIMNDRQDGVVYGSRVDGMTSLTAGVTVKLGKTGFNRVGRAELADYSQYNAKINSLRENLESSENENQALKNALANERNRKPVVKEVISSKATPVALFFSIGKSELDKKELTNLEFYVKNALSQDKNKVFTLIGSADKQTGSAEFNEKLTQKRVDYVYDLLVNKYGVDETRLVKAPQGDSQNRFSEPALNRVVIIE